MATTRNEHLLVEIQNFKDLNVPLTRTSRLRYTSLSVSERLIVLGSNTGGIYIFSKSDCKLLQIAFADKETAAVTLLLISPNEKFVAFSVSTGKIHVIDLKLDTRSKSETLRSVTDTGGAIVTCIKWENTSSKLFIGDDMGKVTMVPVYTSKAKSLFSMPMEVIMKLDSAVVQIDKSEDKLLVSTVTCCYLCNTSRQHYTQIGKKPRDGQFGACFLSQGSSGYMIYCARPGSRIWEVDIEGTVLNTHQFKQLLAVAPVSILDINRNFTLPEENETYPGQSIAFPKLKIISGRFLLSWNSYAIYVLDPVNVRLVLWTNHFDGILDVHCVRDEIYIFMSTMNVHCLKLMPVSKAIHTCMDETRIEVVARLCCYYGNILHRKHLRKHLGIQDLYKIYNALELNEMHDLSGEVLGCIKEIEQKVAMETDTDTSSSSRSRSSSLHSVGSEITSTVTDTKDVQNKKEASVEMKSAIINSGIGDLTTDTDLTIDGLDVQSSKLIDPTLTHDVKKEIPDIGSGNGANDETISEPILLNTTTGVTTGDSAIIIDSHNKFLAEDSDGFLNSTSFKSEVNELSIEGVELERGEPEGQSCSSDYNESKDQLAVCDHVNKLETIEASDQNRTSRVGEDEQLDFSEVLDEQNQPNDSQLSATYQDTFDSVTNKDIASVKIPEASQSQSCLIDPSSESQDIVDDDFDDDDTFDANLTDRRSFGPRRPSLTSLSSFSSAEVTMDLPFPESEEQIAIQVKRRVPVKKKKKKRKSSSDILVDRTKGITTGSPVSVGSSKSLSEETPGPTVDVITDGDNVSQYSNDYTDGVAVIADVITGTHDDNDGNTDTPANDVFVGNIDTPIAGNVAIDTLQLEIPKIITNTPTDDYSGSGEFHQSSDWGMSGEFTTSDSTFLQSFEQSTDEKLSVSPTSARKIAFRKFKDKMQNQVTSKTKKLIQNIKDKNIISKAKELAETLSQVPDLSLVSGGYLDPQQFDIYNEQTGYFSGPLDTGARERDSLDGIPTEIKPLVDVSDLQIATDKVKSEMEDPRIFTDIDNVNRLLAEWIVVLNQTIHKYHVKRFAPSVQQDDSLQNENSNSISVSSSGSVKQSDGEMVDNSSYNNGENDPTVNNEGNLEQQRLDKDVNSCDVNFKLTYDNFEKILSDPDFCYLSDPLKLPPELFTNVSKFVHACFELGCHGNILAYQKLQHKEKPKKEDICDSDKSDESIDKIDTSLTNVKIEDSDLCNSAMLGTIVTKSDASESVVLSHKLQDSSLSDYVGDVTDKQKGTEESPSCEIIDDKTAESSDNTVADTNTELIPNAICDIINSSSMNFFIRLYYPYLEIHKIKRESLSYPEWAALVTCLQGCAIDEGERLGIKDDSIISHILETQHQRNGGLILLGHVSRLFYTKNSSVIDSSVRCYPHIQPIDILYLCRYHGVTVETVFKQYMLKLLEHLKKIHKPDIGECLFGNSQVRLLWLEILLAEDFSTDRLMDKQGNPRVMAHKAVQKNDHLMEQVLSKLSSYQTTDLKDLLAIFYKYGYWKGVLMSLKYLKETHEHSRIILYLGDIELLSDQPIGYLPINMEEWENLLTSFKEFNKTGIQKHETELSDWSTSVTWNSLAILLVKNVGPQLALALLKKLDVENGVLNPEFYKTCLLSSIVQKQKRSILHSMLEKVDMYLWSQRPAVVTPQVHYLLVNEEKIKGVSSEKGVSHGEETIQSMTAMLKGDKSSQQLPLTEDPDCHWGVKTKFNMLCGCCNIPLKEVVSHSKPGVLLFRCGHGYHKQCLPNRECLLCDDDLQD